MIDIANIAKPNLVVKKIRRTDLMPEYIPLSLLEPGQEAIIIKIGGEGLNRRRFMEMGFIKGEKIRVERIAPLGDPIEYIIKGYHLSLRRADAGRILVSTENGQKDV